MFPTVRSRVKSLTELISPRSTPPPSLAILLVRCLVAPPASAPSSSPRSRHESPVQKWMSFPAFGVGVAASFSFVSSFLFPRAYVARKRAKADRSVELRRDPYGFYEQKK